MPSSALGLDSGLASGSAAVTSGSTVPSSSSAALPPFPDTALPPQPDLADASASSHHSQHTARQLEHSRRVMRSPDGRRTPVPPPPPPNNSVQPANQYQFLPAHLAAQLAALPPLPAPPLRRSCHSHGTAAAPSVSFDL
jgi:hypothetical protein